MRYQDCPSPLAVAHRGGAGLAPENTLEAFERSFALGVRHLETDVRASADGEAVAFHDARLERVTSASGRVGERTLGQLRQLRVLGGGPAIPLEELLTTFPTACVTLDIKDPAVVGPLARTLRRTHAVERVCVAGARRSWVRELSDAVARPICTALSWRELARLATPRAGGYYGSAAFAHVPLRLGNVPVFREGLVARAHDAGLRVLVWTVNDAATMHRLLDHGVDGVITDRPDLLREVLLARGQWHTPDAHPAPLTG